MGDQQWKDRGDRPEEVTMDQPDHDRTAGRG